MKQGILSFSDVRELRASPVFMFSLLVFACGLFLGGFAGMTVQIERTVVSELAGELSGFSGQMPTFKTVVIGMSETFGWVGLLLVAGSWNGSACWISLVLLCRGFLLSFTVAACVQSCGWQGVVLSLMSAGMSAVLSVPALLLAASMALPAGQERQKRGYVMLLARYRSVWVWCALLLGGAALWRLLVVPVILSLCGMF